MTNSNPRMWELRRFETEACKDRFQVYIERIRLGEWPVSPPQAEFSKHRQDHSGYLLNRFIYSMDEMEKVDLERTLIQPVTITALEDFTISVLDRTTVAEDKPWRKFVNLLGAVHCRFEEKDLPCSART